MCVPLTLEPCSFFDNGSSNPHPLQRNLPKRTSREISPLRTESPSNFCPPDQKIGKKEKKKSPRLTHLEAAVAMLFSLQRQDMMFPSLRQEGYITAPHQHCRRVSSRPWGSLLAPFFDSPESIGMEGIHLQLPLRCPLGSQCLMSLPKSWSQSQVGLSTGWGPGTQGLCFKTPTHWELLTSRDSVLT